VCVCGRELFTCEAPVHKHLLNKMAEQHRVLYWPCWHPFASKETEEIYAVLFREKCVLWSAKYGKLVIWWSSDSSTWQLYTLIQNDTFRSNQTIQLCLEVKIQNKKHRNEICIRLSNLILNYIYKNSSVKNYLGNWTSYVFGERL
jgi:hypothetical protein